MNIELTVLAASVLLGIFHLLIVTGACTQQRGLQWNMGPRDIAPAALTGKTARLDRSFQNFKETFPFFVAAVLLISATGHGGNLSEIGVLAYLVARIFYIPLYAFGVTVARTLVWFVSVLGIVAVVLQAFV